MRKISIMVDDELYGRLTATFKWGIRQTVLEAVVREAVDTYSQNPTLLGELLIKNMEKKIEVINGTTTGSKKISQ